MDNDCDNCSFDYYSLNDYNKRECSLQSSHCLGSFRDLHKRTDITYGIQNDITLTVAVSAILIILTIIIELEWILLLENKNLNFYSFSSYPIGTT